MASRSDSKDDAYSFQLENQRGERVQLKEEDQRALVMGLALHDMGKAALAKKEYESALNLLTTAEESFSIADKQLLGAIDNVGMLLLDIVWCCYKLGDARRLAVARERLVRARHALEHAYGPGLQRLRHLHGSQTPELAIYTRLEALEAVAAYHSGDISTAERLLQAAQRHWSALQVSDVKLAQLQGMGYEPEEARRALRLSGGDIDAAITFITNQRIAQEEAAARRRKDARWKSERKKYGRTPQGEYVKEEGVDKLSSLGYDRELSALVLRLTNNNAEAGLESLLDEQARGFLVQLLSALQRLAAEGEEDGGGPSTSSAATCTRPARGAYKQLLSADAAGELAGLWASCQQAGGFMSDEEVACRLHSALHSIMHPPKPYKRPRAEAGSSSAAGAGASSGDGSGEAGSATGQGSGSAAVPMAANGQAAGMGTDAGVTAGEAAEGDEEQAGEDGLHASDAEMEEDVRAALQSDAMASYDVEVQEEGELIQTYMAMCASARAAGS